MCRRAVRPLATLLVLATMACGDCEEWMPTSDLPRLHSSGRRGAAHRFDRRWHGGGDRIAWEDPVNRDHRGRALFLLLLMLLTGSACSSWVPAGTPIPLRDSTRIAGRVRLTDSASVRHVAPWGAVVHGPSVLFAREYRHADSVPTRSVVFVEKAVPNIGGTIGVVALVGLAGLVALAIAVAASGGMGSFSMGSY